MLKNIKNFKKFIKKYLKLLIKNTTHNIVFIYLLIKNINYNIFGNLKIQWIYKNINNNDINNNIFKNLKNDKKILD